MAAGQRAGCRHTCPADVPHPRRWRQAPQADLAARRGQRCHQGERRVLRLMRIKAAAAGPRHIHQPWIGPACMIWRRLARAGLPPWRLRCSSRGWPAASPIVSACARPSFWPGGAARAEKDLTGGVLGRLAGSGAAAVPRRADAGIRRPGRRRRAGGGAVRHPAGPAAGAGGAAAAGGGADALPGRGAGGGAAAGALAAAGPVAAGLSLSRPSADY